MKRSNDFLLKNVAGKLVLVPVGKAAVSFPGMITVNPAGQFIWELLETEQTLDSVTQAMTARYEVDAETAREDAKVFIDRLKTVKAITE